MFNSVIPFIRANPNELSETIGITKQPAGDENTWYQIMGGLILQGGATADIAGFATLTVSYIPAYPKKVLGIWLQTRGNVFAAAAVRNYYVDPVDLTQFVIYNDYVDASSFFWWAVGY